MTPRVLVLYGTTEGHTRKIAGALGTTFRAMGAAVDVVDASVSPAPGPSDFDAVVVAGSVHAGTYQRAVRRWVKTHAAALGKRPTAFVSVCLAVLEQTPAVDRHLTEILERFFAETGWRPNETRIVAGALPYTKYSWWKRWLMKRIVARAHGDTDTSRDYEYTDWTDLDAFARRFAERIVPRAHHAA